MAKFIRVASTREIPSGTGRYIDIDGEPVAIFHVADGHFYATCDICTHEEASLSEGELDGEIVECPLHGAKYNVRTGDVKALPAVVGVKTYPTRVVGDDLEIEI